MTVPELYERMRVDAIESSNTWDDLDWRGTRYLVRSSVVETYRGHADVVILDSTDRCIVLYA